MLYLHFILTCDVDMFWGKLSYFEIIQKKKMSDLSSEDEALAWTMKVTRVEWNTVTVVWAK